jgi:hypothetical protein
MPSGITPPHRRPGVSLGTEGADGTGRGSSAWCGNVWWYECIRTHWHLYRYILHYVHSIQTLIASLAFHAILVCKLYANPTCHAAREGTSSDMGAPASPHPHLMSLARFLHGPSASILQHQDPKKYWMYIIYICICIYIYMDLYNNLHSSSGNGNLRFC